MNWQRYTTKVQIPPWHAMLCMRMSKHQQCSDHPKTLIFQESNRLLKTRPAALIQPGFRLKSAHREMNGTVKEKIHAVV